MQARPSRHDHLLEAAAMTWLREAVVAWLIGPLWVVGQFKKR
jgi:hypothetical protein